MTPQERLAAQLGSTTPATIAGSKPIEQMTPAERLALQLGMQQQQASPGRDDDTQTGSHVVECDGGMEL